jgi:AAA15 family ATPase/GTPase
MGFKSIEIRGFRSLNALKIDHFTQINLFVGKNNSGKTTLLESIFILSGASNPRLPLSVNGFRDYRKLRDDDFIVLFNGLSPEKNILIEGTETNDHQRSLRLIPVFTENLEEHDMTSNGSRVIKGLTLDFSYKKRHQSTIKIKTRLEIKDEKIDIDIKDIHKSKYNEQLVSTFLNTFITLNHLGDRVSEIIKAKQKQKVIAILQSIEPKITDIHTEDDAVYFDMGMERFIPLNMAGDGMKRILSVITAIFSRKNGIVLIDEIDNGLHYSTQAILWQAIIRSATEFNVQIFATTHSSECIQALSDVCEKHFKEKELATLFRIEKTVHGHTAHSFNQNLLLTAIENNIEIR